MMTRSLLMRRQRGFTLLEAIVTMVLTGILAGIMVLFIRRPMASYIDTAARAEMTDVAEIALRRMARELHGALPNSIRWTVINNVSYVEFIPTKAGGIYLAEEDGADTSLHTPLSFSSSASTQFEVVGAMPVAPYAIAAGDFIVVYNLGNGIANADAYAGNNRAQVAGVGTAVGGRNAKSVVFSGANPFGAQNPVNKSPGNRFQVVTMPVTFACANDATTGRGTLTRFWGYGFQASQVNPVLLASTSSALMANNVVGCQFSVQQAANQNTALIGLSIALGRMNADAGGLETVTLSQQIHVDNTP